MSVRTSSYQVGIAAEKLAAQYFQSLGFPLTSQRYKTRFGEIDLIVKKDNQLIFVEVKARSRKILIEDLITQKQIDRNYAAAEFFLSEFPEYSTYDCRFDLIIICRNRIIQHIVDVRNF